MMERTSHDSDFTQIDGYGATGATIKAPKTYGADGETRHYPHTNGSASDDDLSHVRSLYKPNRDDGKHELQDTEAWHELGFSWPAKKKWAVLSTIFLVQCSMNFNASVYANGLSLLEDKYGVSEPVARLGQMIFLIAYAFGCELWAPPSEEIGRWPTLQLSLFLVNIWQVLAALAPNFGSVLVARFLGGICSAGGSVTLGMVADMWQAREQQYAVAFVVFSSVFGSVIGPLVGPFIEVHLSWQWIAWTQLIFGAFVQFIHFWSPETNSRVLLDRAAKRLRTVEGLSHVYGPLELEEDRFAPRKLLRTWIRPFEMFLTEPIVLWCSLLSGFSDALIFTFLAAFPLVYKQWGFSAELMATTFVPIAIGYFLAWIIYLPFLNKQRRVLKKNPDAEPEMRLRPLLYLAPLEAIGLLGFAWTSLGPQSHVHWIAPMIFSVLVGIANYAIYMSTIDYMISAYGPYSASATGGNGLARDFLAGIAALYSAPFYSNVGGPDYRLKLEWPSTILGIIAALLTIPIYVFYFKGKWFRERSKFAQSLAGKSKERDGRMNEKNQSGQVEHREN